MKAALLASSLHSFLILPKGGALIYLIGEKVSVLSSLTLIPLLQ